MGPATPLSMNASDSQWTRPDTTPPRVAEAVLWCCIAANAAGQRPRQFVAQARGCDRHCTGLDITPPRVNAAVLRRGTRRAANGLDGPARV